MAKPPKAPVRIETLTHTDAKRKNISTAEHQSVMDEARKNPLRVAYERRNKDLDPQLVWRGKDVQDWSDLVVHAPPVYIQEKIHPKVLIDDLRRRSEAGAAGRNGGPVRRLQRHSPGHGQDRVLRPRPELVQPKDPRRLSSSDGQPHERKDVHSDPVSEVRTA